MSITVELEGVGVSLVTKRPDELLYFTARGLKVVYNDFPTYYDVLLDCKWIQIDNQLFGGLFPIVFYPTVVPKDGKELDSHPTVQLAVALLKDQCECRRTDCSNPSSPRRHLRQVRQYPAPSHDGRARRRFHHGSHRLPQVQGGNVEGRHQGVGIPYTSSS